MALIETGASTAVPTSGRYRVLAAACVLAVITYIHRVGFATAAAEFKGPLGLDQRQLSYLMAAFMLAYGGFEIPWGWLGDRFGVRNPLAVIVLGGSLATAALALVTSLPAGAAALGFLLALRFLFGAFQAGTFPSLSRMTADWMPETERGRAQGLVWTSSRLGGALSPLLVGQLTFVLGDWRAAMAAIAVLGVAWCVVFLPWFRDRPADMTEDNAAGLERIEIGRSGGTSTAGGVHGLAPLRQMARSRSAWALCLMYGCLGYSGNFFVTLLPEYLRTNRGLTAATAQWLSSLPFACGVVACLLGGAFSDAIIRRTGDRTRGRRLIGSAGMALAAAAIVGTLWVRDVRALGLLLCLTFFGNDLAMAPAWSPAADVGGRLAGSLGGAMNMLANLSSAVASLGTGYLLQAGQVRLPFVVFAGAYTLGALCWLRVDLNEAADG
jgi:sugar phosphate permease